MMWKELVSKDNYKPLWQQCCKKQEVNPLCHADLVCLGIQVSYKKKIIQSHGFQFFHSFSSLLFSVLFNAFSPIRIRKAQNIQMRVWQICVQLKKMSNIKMKTKIWVIIHLLFWHFLWLRNFYCEEKKKKHLKGNSLIW